MKRAVVIVLDSVGIGEMPDAHKFGDVGSNTLVNIKKNVSSLNIDNLCSLGLGNIDGKDIELLGKTKNPLGSFGKMAERSFGKDTTTGHWEIAGIITENPFPTFSQNGFPPDIIGQLENETGLSFLGNLAASGTEIINTLGDYHVNSGFPIIYTSADSVFQIAAHEDVFPVEKLYDLCKTARKILTGDYAVARVIARPFTGTTGNYVRTKNRKDFSLSPTSKTLLDYTKEKGMDVVAVGKIEDIFQNQGITMTNHTTNNDDGVTATIEYLNMDFSGILFTNLVDFDSLYGHRNDFEGYKNALEAFDKRLPEILSALKDDDILFITADHGCDPTTTSTDHSREFVPLLVYGKHVKKGVNLGCRQSFADLGKTARDYLGLDGEIFGTSFLKDIIKSF